LPQGEIATERQTGDAEELSLIITWCANSARQTSYPNVSDSVTQSENARHRRRIRTILLP
jgi:hypothetical protein